jgi:hypothetical protein
VFGPVVLDFGLAKRAEGVSTHPDDATQTAAPTTRGTVLGTVGYMSPEQAEGRDVDARTDIFSFGTVLYEMLTGRRTFKGDTAARTLTAVLRDEPEPIELHAPGVSKELARIVRFCLRKDPERRYQSITDVKLALQEGQAESGAADSPPVVRTARGRWIVLASVVVAAASTWYAFTRGSESQAPVVVTPLTMFSGVASSPAVSPDGKMVAFGWDGDRGNLASIYVKMIGGGEPLRLTRDPALDRSPVWSPDGRAIAFSRSSSLHPQLFRAHVMVVPVLGGGERRVGSGLVQDWSPDGSTLLAARDDPGEPAGHFLIAIRDGESRRLTTSAPGSTLGSACFSPEGGGAAYARIHHPGFLGAA